MPRVHHVKKARKDNPVCKRGESYYWWKFRHGGKRYSLTYPKRSQLTQSGHLAAIYDAEDHVGEQSIDPTDAETLNASMEAAKDAIENAKEVFESERDEYEQSADNVEEYFPGSEKAEEIREKGQACETAADECDSIVDTLQECIDRLDEHGDKPTRDDAEAEVGIEDGEDEDDYITKVDEHHDEMVDAWQVEFDDIANDAENALGEFNGVEFY